MPKVVVCLVNGWAAGGGHSLHVVCDLTLASAEHARFKQTDADVGSFDGGYGSAYLARQVGQKFAREIFFLGQEYSAEDGVPHGRRQQGGPARRARGHRLEWGRLINGKSPQAQRMLKYAFNLLDDGLVGQQLFAGEATRMAYMTDEAVEGRDQFLEKREPDWSRFPWSTDRMSVRRPISRRSSGSASSRSRRRCATRCVWSVACVVAPSPSSKCAHRGIRRTLNGLTLLREEVRRRVRRLDDVLVRPELASPSLRPHRAASADRATVGRVRRRPHVHLQGLTPRLPDAHRPERP